MICWLIPYNYLFYGHINFLLFYTLLFIALQVNYFIEIFILSYIFIKLFSIRLYILYISLWNNKKVCSLFRVNEYWYTSRSKSLTSLFRERVSFAFTSIFKKTRLRREGSSSQGKKVSSRIEGTTQATVFLCRPIEWSFRSSPRNLRAPSWWGFRACARILPPNIFTRVP